MKKVLILGESNSVYRDGWVAGFSNELGNNYTIENQSVGSSGIFNAIIALIKIGSSIAKYDHILIDSCIQDASFFHTKIERYLSLLQTLVGYLDQFPASLCFIQFEALNPTPPESLFCLRVEQSLLNHGKQVFRIRKMLEELQKNSSSFGFQHFYSDNHHVKREVAYQLGVTLARQIQENIPKQHKACLKHPIEESFVWLDANFLGRDSGLMRGRIHNSLLELDTVTVTPHPVTFSIPPSLRNFEVLGIVFNASDSNGILEISSENIVRKNLSNSSKKVWKKPLQWARILHTPVLLSKQLTLAVGSDYDEIEPTEYCSTTEYRKDLPQSVELIGFVLVAKSFSEKQNVNALITTNRDALSIQGKRFLADLFGRSQFDETISWIHALHEVLPNDSFTWKVLGAALIQKLKYSDAIQAMKRAIQLSPTDPELYNNLGAAYHMQGNATNAERNFRRALELRNDYQEAYSNLIDLYFESSRYAHAEQLLRHLLGFSTATIEIRGKLGICLYHQKKFEESCAIFTEIVKEQPESYQAHNNLANSLFALKETDKARNHYQIALKLKPDYVEGLSNLSHLYSDIGQYEQAETLSIEALKIQPNHAGALSNRALALRGLNRLVEASLCLRTIVRAQPYNEEAKTNLAYILLMLGQFDEGWPLHDARFHRNNPKRVFSPPDKLQTLWQGESLQDRIILIWPEQGIGDQIQFIRYIEKLKEKEPRQIYIYCITALHSLFCSLGDAIVQIVPEGAEIPEHDYWAPLLSLPYHCKSGQSTIPTTIPYLHADKDMVRKLGMKLDYPDTFKIGLCWSGSTGYKYDRERSIGIAAFDRLKEIPNIKLFNLQPNSREQFLSQFGETAFDLGHEIDAESPPFVETAALLMHLDLIITCDTSIGHLAGSLGKTVWLLLPYVADWRWLTARDDSPWYPKTRLFRQNENRDWNSVFDRVHLALTQHEHYVSHLYKHRSKIISPYGKSTSVQIPISVGEFFDRLSILELKESRITDKNKLNAVKQELRELQTLMPRQENQSPELVRLCAQLRKVNEDIWNVEEAIRDCEDRMDFGPTFIKLARAVYLNNDQRATLKNQINRLMDSKFVEVKSHKNIP